MGRKIPSKKHRGVKDPIEQQARRMQSLKGKINAPPKDPDEQPIPQSLVRLFAFKNKVQKDEKKPKKINKMSLADGAMKSTANPIARLKQLPGESGRSFSLRINGAIKALNDPIDQDYPEDIDMEDSKGERMAAQRDRRRRKQQKNKKHAVDTPKLSRSQKLAAKLKAKKDALDAIRPEFQYDRVQFGDVTHGPPAITTRPRRAAQVEGAARPGRRDLLLSSMLQGGTKTLSGAAERERERQEKARLDVVAAYRLHKKQQREQEQRGRKKHPIKLRS